MRPYKPRSHVAVGVAKKKKKKESSLLKAMSAKHRYKFGNGESRRKAEILLMRLYTNKQTNKQTNIKAKQRTIYLPVYHKPDTILRIAQELFT
jgi:hypothetical protein